MHKATPAFNINAGNKLQLLSRLASINVDVPARGCGRTKIHTEHYTMLSLLRVLANARHLKYPVEVLSHDKPDFLIRMDGNVIGVEHTEAVPENHAVETSCRNRGCGPRSGYFFKVHRPGENTKTTKQIIGEINADPYNSDSPGFAGDECELIWSAAMKNVIEKKQEMTVNYDKCDCYWLLIYDNWPLPAVDLYLAMTYLQKEGWSNSSRAFDDVWIVTEKKACHIAATSRFDIFDVPRERG